MSLIASIDGDTRRVYLGPDTVGADVHPIDIYREMRAFRSSDESLRKYNLFMKADGNVPKGGGKATERYVTLLEGTRLVPFNTTHEITITGTIITDTGEEGIECFDRTPLNANSNVNINYVPPQVEVITIPSGSGLSVEQDTLLNELHSGINKIVHVDPSLLAYGDGSPTAPFNTVNAAVSYAEVKSINILNIHSDCVLDADISNMKIEGLTQPKIDLNGRNIDSCDFYNCEIEGSSTGAATYKECNILDGTTGMNGIYYECALSGDVVIESGAYIIAASCFSGIPGSNRPSIDMTSSAGAQLAFRDWAGGLELRNCVAGAAVTIGMNHGELRLAASCTGGTVHIRGVGYYENLGMTAVIDRAFLECTNGGTGLDEGSLHNALDAYTNKDDWKASETGLNEVQLHTALDNYANKELWKATDVDLTPVLDAIAALNDVTPAEVRAAFNAEAFKAKNTELEVHTWLDSYLNKDDWKDGTTIADVTEGSVHTALDSYVNKANWKDEMTQAEIHAALDTYAGKDGYKADVSGLSTDVNVTQVGGVAVTGVGDFKLDPADISNDVNVVSVNDVVVAGPDDFKAAEVDANITRVNNALVTLADFKEKFTIAEMHNALDSYANKANWKSDMTSVLSAIDGLTDATPAEVRAAFVDADFHDKNTEAEIHAWLDSYTSKDAWKNDTTTVEAKIDAANTAIAGLGQEMENRVKKVTLGGEQVVGTQMIIKDTDGTVIAAYDLFDNNGNPTNSVVFEKRPV